MQRKWKRRWQRLAKTLLPPVAASLLLLSFYNPVFASPAGGAVISGSATISSNGSTTSINQTTNKATINWQSFSIGNGEIVNFVQPSSTAVALNRVIGSDASRIYGSLNANGKVYLINQNGILFSSTAQVNVGGLVASTLNISDSDFVSGKYTFKKDGGAGSVVNQGTITAVNEAVLIGSKVANEGIIAAKVTGLAAGNKVSLDFSGDNLLNVAVDTGAASGSATNSGTIAVNGGLVVMSAGTKETLLGTVVNNSGVIRAQSVNNVGGVIRLEGSTMINSGILHASGQTGGTVKVLGDTVTLTAGSIIDVSGDVGGGTALIGGAYQGGLSEYTATTTTVASGATITADAVISGNGGTVVVWANDITTFAGTITAKGGKNSGNGGSVETSGKKMLTVSDTARVNTTATNGSTGNWLLDPDDYIIGTGNVGTIITNLATTDVTIATSASGTGGSGDIAVNDAVSWGSNHTLTLSAYRNININVPITAASGGLYLGAGGTIIAPAAVNVKTFILSGGIWSQIGSGMGGVLPIFNVNDFHINGGTFIRAISGDGMSASPYKIADVYGLQGVASSGMLGKYYTLGNNIEASGTKEWNGGEGFVPIGANNIKFKGTFNGGGHTVTGLTINRPSTDGVGLFGWSIGTISNVGLIDGSITGGFYVGGLVGWNDGNKVITNSYNTGAVKGKTDVGGLVGANKGTITNSYSTGAVTGSFVNAGGLVGENFEGTITNSYSAGLVTGTDGNAGGLVGLNNGGTIESSYSMGAVRVTGTSKEVGVGGLVGVNDAGSSIMNSYSTGEVTGNTGSNYVGGLVGNNKGTITNNYSTGTVNSTGIYVGGLVGVNDGGTIANSFWNVNTSGKTTGIGINGGNGGATGLTTAQMKQAASYSGWNIATTGGSSSVWRIYDGYSYPLLRSFLTPLAVAVTGGSTTYNGSAYAGATYGYSVTPDSALLLGTLFYTYDGSTTAPKNAGNYIVSGAGLYSGQQGYDIGYATGTLMISPKIITYSVADTASTYGTLPTPAVTLSGLVSGDESTVMAMMGLANSSNHTVTLAYNTAAGIYTESVRGLIGTASSNYKLAANGNTTGTLTISPKTITYSVADATSIYGTLATPVVTLNGLVSGDKSTVTGTVELTDSSNHAVMLAYNTAAGNYTESMSGLTGTASGNYVLAANGNTTGTLTISPKTITYSVADTISTYGTLASTGAVTLSGLVNGDESAVTGTMGLADSSNHAVMLAYNTAAGSYTESVNGLTGAASGNYKLAANGNTTGTLAISPKTITYSVPNVTSTYGTLASTGAVTLGGLVNGDESAVTGTVGLTDSSNHAVTLAYNTAVGNYTESVSALTGAASGNYKLAANGNKTGTLTISPKTITYSVPNVTSTYGTLPSTGAVTLSGLVSGDESAITGTMGLTDSSNHAVTLAYNTAVGSYAESVSTLSGTASGNYVLAVSGNTIGTLTISPKTITYSVADATSTYGTLATPAVTLNGLVSGDESKVTGTVGLTNSSNHAVMLAYNTAAGSYIESMSGLTGTASGNYVLAANGNTTGTLMINPKTITYSVADVTSTYGTLATPAVTLSGPVSGDESAVTGTVGLTDSSNHAVTLAYNTAAGSYIESVSGLTGKASGNYVLAANGNTTGSLTIFKVDLTITASNQSKTYGKSLSLGTTVFGVSGLVDGDSVNSVVLLSSGADATAKVGKYAITASGASGSGLDNYNITYGNGMLTVSKAPWQFDGYTGAVIHADYMANGSLGLIGRYGYGGLASGYMTIVSGGVAPLSIVGAGINTGGYLMMGDTL